MEVPKNIKDEIWEYCRLNDITDIDSFMLKSLQQGFNIQKYGSTPFKINQKEPEVIEKEVIKEIEVIKEVPVEVIREVEKEVIKEVPVEKIVEVEKEIYISDDEQVEELRTKLIESQKEASKYLSGWEDKLSEVTKKEEKIQELEKTITSLHKTASHNEIILGSEEIQRLERKIMALEVELELEQNRNFVPEKKEPIKKERPKIGGKGNIINWISKKERDSDDIYDE
jgi:hypothetical protein